MSVIVDINHEVGDLTEYTATQTDSGDLSVTAGAALVGTYGLSVLIDGAGDIYGEYNLGSNNTSGQYRQLQTFTLDTPPCKHHSDGKTTRQPPTNHAQTYKIFLASSPPSQAGKTPCHY